MGAAKVRKQKSKRFVGRPCLDFANSLNVYPRKQQRDSLSTYDDLVDWSRRAGVIDDQESRYLLKQSAQKPDQASIALDSAIELRGVLSRMFSVIARGRSPSYNDLQSFNVFLPRALDPARLSKREGVFEIDFDSANALAGMLSPVIWSAVELLRSADLARVRMCSEESCRLLFIDESRNGSRRWCDMSGCGNRAKARAHYMRKAGRIGNGDRGKYRLVGSQEPLTRLEAFSWDVPPRTPDPLTEMEED